jgi:hypothetical protein
MAWDSAAEQLLAFGAVIRFKRGASRCRWPRESRNKGEVRRPRVARNRAAPEDRGRALLKVGGRRYATPSVATSSRPSARWRSPRPSTSAWSRSGGCSRTSRGSRSRSVAALSSGSPRPLPASTKERSSSTFLASCATCRWRSGSLRPRKHGAVRPRPPLPPKAGPLPPPRRTLPVPLPSPARRLRRPKVRRLPPKLRRPPPNLLPKRRRKRPHPRRCLLSLRLLPRHPRAANPQAHPLPASSYARGCWPRCRNSPKRS